MAQEEPVPLRVRRNAKQASCEPCRISKVRCSHDVPCRRCIRQGTPSKCIVHPAPMTRDKVKSTATTAVSTPASTAAKTTPGFHYADPPQRNPGKVLNPLRLESGGSIGYSRKALKTFSLGYMGSTGHSAILLEHRDMSDIWRETDHQQIDDETSSAPLKDGQPEHPAIQKFCSAILSWLPPKPVADQVLRRLFEKSMFDDCQITGFRNMVDSFWSTYGAMLHDPGDTGQSAEFINELCANTRLPFPVPATNEEWTLLTSGRRLRWSVVGDICLSFGYALYLIPHDDPLMQSLLKPGLSAKEFCLSMLECADACLMLSDELEVESNILTVQLLCRCIVFQSVVTGDSSYELWKRCGLLMHAITGLGLHRRLESSKPVALCYEHCRSSTFAHAFHIDKIFATFLGRPPALSRQYVTCPLPIDASWDDIRQKSSLQLNEELDGNGWNRRGDIFSSTIARANMIMSLIRDEILELSLGKPTADLSKRVEELRAHGDLVWSQFPSIFHLTLSKKCFTVHGVSKTSTVVSVKLSFLQNEFLLERVDHPQQDRQRFLFAARRMLSLVVIYWNEREHLGFGHRDELHWFITCYGIPAASALAIDLWKQTIPSHTMSPSPERSQVIQDLSLFLACLSWIEPQDGNYILCTRVQKMVKHILDRVLTPSMALDQAQQQSPGFGFTDMSMADFPVFGADFENWFEITNSHNGVMLNAFYT